MEHVKVKWLRILNYGLIGFTGVLFSTYFLFEKLGVSQATKDRWGITTVILALGVMHAIYVVISDRIIVKRFPWISTVISIAMYAFLTASIIESSGNTNIAYRAFYTALIFFSAMTGIFAPVAAIIFTWMILIFTVTGVATPTKASLTFNIIADIAITLAGTIGWLIFRKYYVNSKDKDTKLLENVLEQEQFKSTVILESITDGVMIISPKGNIQLINKSGATMLGWGQAEALNLDYKTVLTPLEESTTTEPTAIKTAIAMSLESGKPAQKVGLFKTRSKEKVYFDIVASPITVTNDDNTVTSSGVVAVLRDVSESRAQEKRSADFVSTASHEMRTPVAAIEGYLALALNERVSQIDSKARDYLEKAHESTQHLGRLFQDLLTSTKAEDGRLSNHPKVIEMSQFTEKIVEDLRFSAEKKGLHMEYVMGTPEGNVSTNTNTGDGLKIIKPFYYVNVDPERIREVITNLFDNAVKYTEAGTVSLGLTGNNEVVQLSISDTGLGIPAEDIPHLFQKFYRVDSTITRTIGGTGLGLFICSKIIELYNGRIWVESTLGKGSTFYINIPRLTNEKAKQLQAIEASTVTTVAPLSTGNTT